MSSDEKTGIQALEPKHPSLSMKAGKVARREFEYSRHGTQTLIANFEVATAKLVTPSVGATRSEDDFAAHITQTLASDPEASWLFIVDPLNTHKSEALVLLVNEHCQLDLDPETLAVKGASGILKSMHTRMTFLSDPSHRIRFIYTPKHASWLN